MGALLWLAARFMPALMAGAHSLVQAAALLIVIAAGIAIYGLFLRVFGVIGWREAINAIRRPRPPTCANKARVANDHAKQASSREADNGFC